MQRSVITAFAPNSVLESSFARMDQRLCGSSCNRTVAFLAAAARATRYHPPRLHGEKSLVIVLQSKQRVDN